MISTKIGLKPPGPGTAASTNRSTLLIATSTPSSATILALSAARCTSSSSTANASTTSTVSTSAASPAWAIPPPKSLCATAGSQNGYRNATSPTTVVIP